MIELGTYKFKKSTEKRCPVGTFKDAVERRISFDQRFHTTEDSSMDASSNLNYTYTGYLAVLVSSLKCG